MTNLFISTDLNTTNSGDITCRNELRFLKSLGDDVIELGFNEIHPSNNKLPDVPFLTDYITLHMLFDMDLSKIKLCHFYGGNYAATVKYLKANGVKVTMTEMFHDRKVSISEHEKLYGEGSYPFQHVKDDKLYKMLIGGIEDVDVIITGGEGPKKTILRDCPKARVEVISHGCNPPDQDKIKPFPKQFRVGYLGAYGPDKGIRYLIEGWSQLNLQDDSILILAGSQSLNLEPFIKAFSTNVGAKYHLAGYINDVADFYNKISLYIQPSTTEGFGLETTEAMSFGRPVICSSGAGSASCITDGEDGFVVPAINSEAIAEKIKYFKDHPDEIIRMGKNARSKSLDITWDKMGEKYIKIWKDLLKNK